MRGDIAEKVIGSFAGGFVSFCVGVGLGVGTCHPSERARANGKLACYGKYLSAFCLRKAPMLWALGAKAETAVISPKKDGEDRHGLQDGERKLSFVRYGIVTSGKKEIE
jgi:hypothetical protein